MTHSTYICTLIFLLCSSASPMVPPAGVGQALALLRLRLLALAHKIHKPVVETRTIHQVATDGDVEALRRLLAQGVAVDSRQDEIDGTTPLHIAAAFGHEAMVKALLQAGADVNLASHYLEETPLYRAIRGGSKDMIAVVRVLLDAGADVNMAQQDGLTPLQIALGYKNNILVQELLDKGANVNAQNRHGYTALHSAAQNGYAEIVKVLLANSANSNVQNKRGETPLHLAAKKSNHEIVKLLLNAGADRTIQDKAGNMPVAYVHSITLRALLTPGAQPQPEEQLNCTICVEQINKGEAVRTLPCGHSFHRACIDRWRQTSRTCPICRGSF